MHGHRTTLICRLGELWCESLATAIYLGAAIFVKFTPCGPTILLACSSRRAVVSAGSQRNK